MECLSSRIYCDTSDCLEHAMFHVLDFLLFNLSSFVPFAHFLIILFYDIQLVYDYSLRNVLKTREQMGTLVEGGSDNKK